MSPLRLAAFAALFAAPTIAGPPPVTAVAYSPDGSLLAAGTRGEAHVFRAGEPVARLAGQAERVTAVAFAPDGKTLAVASGPPGKAGEVRLYAVPAAGPWADKPARILAAHKDAVYGLAFRPDGKQLATCGYDRLVKLWDTAIPDAGPVELKDHSDAVYGLAYRPDGKLLASAGADRAVKVWDVATGKRLYTLGDATDWLYAVAWHPDGKQLAAGGVDKSVRVWEADEKGGRLALSAFAHEKPVSRLAYAADGKLLWSLGEDAVVKAWDAGKLAEAKVFPARPETVLALAVRPDGKQVALGRFDGVCELLDGDGKPEGKPLPAKPKPPEALGLSPAFGPAGVPVRVTLTGRQLDAVTAVAVAAPGATAKVLADGRTPEALPLEVTFPAGTAPGAYALTAKSEAGDAAAQQFTLDRFVRVAEKGGNESARSAQAVKLSATITGVCDRAGDADWFRFEARAGEPVGVQAVAAAGSKIAPVVVLADADGRVLAEGPDGVLGYVCDKAGTYSVGVRDKEFRGGADMGYRLDIGAVPVVTSVHPLGLQRGTEAAVTVYGVHLGEPWVTVTAKAAPDAAVGSKVPLPVTTALGRPLALPDLVVGEFPEVQLPRAAGDATVPVPGTANGFVPGPDGAQEWVFTAKKGQPLVLEVAARRLGSPLDPYLEILDKDGRPMKRATLRCVARTFVTFRDHDSATPNIRLETWNELTENDHVWLNGELLRLRNLPPNPDADAVFYSVEGQRRGYLGTTPGHHPQGTPLYKVSQHPPGTTFPPNGFPVIDLVYRNDDAGPGFGKDARLTFDPPADGEYRARVGDSRGRGGREYGYRLTVRPPRPDFAVRVAPNAPAVWQGGAVPVAITATRIDEFDGPIELRLEGLPEGLSAPPTRLEAGELTTALALAADAKAAVGPAKGPARLVARAVIDGKEVVREASAGVPSVVAPGELATATDVAEVTLKPGGEAKLKVTVDRRGGFAGRIPLEVRGLPHGVRVTDIGLNGILVLPGQTERTVTIRAEPWATPTEHPFVVLSRVEGKGGEYAAPAVRLKVAK